MLYVSVCVCLVEVAGVGPSLLPSLLGGGASTRDLLLPAVALVARYGYIAHPISAVSDVPECATVIRTHW